MKINLGERKRARIEMLPLIDIVFLLLVFFIYAMLSMAVHRALPVALPKSTTAEIDTSSNISVSITSEDYIYFDKQAVDRQQLLRMLRARYEAKKDVAVQVFADHNVDYQRLFSVLDIIKQSGISRISLEAERDGGK